jgi:hypothetical protein
MASNNSNINVNVNVNDEEVVKSEEKFVSLRRQIRETMVQLQALTDAGDTQGKKFSELNLKLSELRTEQEQVNNKTQGLTQTFGLMGGAVGEFGDKAEIGIQALKTLSSFTLQDLKNQFTVLATELKTFLTKIADATGITKIYAATNAFLAESFVAVGVGEEAAATGAKVLAGALVATGIGALIVGLGLAYSGLKELVTGEEAAKAAIEETNREIEAQNLLLTLDEADLKRRTDKRIAQLKAQGASEEEIRKEQRAAIVDGQELLNNTLKEKYETLEKLKSIYTDEGVKSFIKTQEEISKLEQKQKDERTKLAVFDYETTTKNNEKKTQSDKKYADEVKKVNDLIKKEDEKAAENKLEDRNKELLAVEHHFNDIISQARKLGISTKSLEADLALEKQKINDKYDELEKKKKEEKAAKDLAMSKQAATENLNSTKQYLTEQSNQLQESYGDDYATKVQYYEDNKKLLEKQIDDLKIFRDNGYITDKQYTDLVEQNRKARISNEKAEATTIESIITKSYDNRESEIKERFGKFAVFQNAYWDAEKQSLQKSVDDNQRAYEEKKITEQQYLDNKKKNAEASIKLDEAEQQSKYITLQVAADAFNNLSTIAGKQSAAGKAFAIAGTTISTYESATKAYDSLSGIPIVGPALGAIAAAAAIAAGLANVQQIMSISTPGGGGIGGGASAPSRNSTKGLQGYADGGMIYGPSHSQGGVDINAQGGEAVMTRGAVTMFGPLLSMMNQAGGGTSFHKAAIGQARIDNPKTPGNPMQEQPIIKTYVVANEMNTINHRQARLKDLSTL